MRGKALKKLSWDYELKANKCLANNCFGRTFYVIMAEEAFYKRHNEKTDSKFRLMLICQKCGAETIYGKDDKKSPFSELFGR